MKVKVEIDNRELITFTEIANMVAEREMWTLVSVADGVALFRNDDPEYGYRDYKVDLRTGETRARDDGEGWHFEPLPTECPVRDDWDMIPWAVGEDGTVYAVN